MKTSMKDNVVVAVNLLAGFIMTAAPKIWAKPCGGMMTLENGNETHMRCFYSGQALVILGIILLVNALVMFLAKNKLQGGIVAIVISVSGCTRDNRYRTWNWYMCTC